MKYVVILLAGFSAMPAVASMNDSSATNTPSSYDSSLAGRTSTGTSTNTTSAPGSITGPSASDQSGVNMGTAPTGTSNPAPANTNVAP